MIYFDNAATSRKKPKQVYDAFNYYLSEIGVSPGRGSYSLAIQASRMLYQARKVVSCFFGGTDPGSVVFTKNSTEAINLFFNGFLNKGDHVLISPYEHNAVLRPLHNLKEKGIIEYTILPEDVFYSNKKSIKKYIKNNTRLIAVTLASNLTGQVVFSAELAKYVHGLGLAVFVDASQGAGKKLIDMQRDDIDFLAFTGHKDLLAFPGVGGLIGRENFKIKPLIQGGTGIHGESYVNPEAYPDSYEAGTLNMPAIWALKTALEYINLNVVSISEKENILLDKIINKLSSNPKIEIYNLNYPRVPTFCFNVKGVPSNEVVKYLSEKNVCVRGGIHCAILAHEAIGTVEKGAIRVSLNSFNSEEEVNEFIRIIEGM